MLAEPRCTHVGGCILGWAEAGGLPAQQLIVVPENKGGGGLGHRYGEAQEEEEDLDYGLLDGLKDPLPEKEL